MPIEIKELIVKAYIDDSSEQEDPSYKTLSDQPDSAELIIAACVEQVLQILKDKEER